MPKRPNKYYEHIKRIRGLMEKAGIYEERYDLQKLAARKKAGTIDGNGDGVSGKERTV